MTIALLFALGTLANTFTISLQNFNVNAADMGLFAEMSRIHTTGGVLYRDLWDNKPPGLFVFTSAFVRIFGNTQLAIGASLVANGILFIAAMAALVWEVTHSRAALFAGLLLAIYYTAAQELLETTFLMATLTAAAIAFAVKAKGNPALLILSGALYAAAIFTKQPALLEFPVILLFALLWTPRQRKQQVVAILSLGTGMALVIGGILLWAVHNQILESFWFHVFESSVQYVTGEDGGWHFRDEAIELFRNEFLPSLVYLSLLFVGAGFSLILLLRRSSNRKVLWLIALWVVITFCAASVARGLKAQYYTQALPPLILMASLGAKEIVRLQAWRQVVILCIFVGLGILLYPQISFPLSFGHRELFSEKNVAYYIMEHTDEDDCLWTWGYLQALNYLSARSSCNSAPYEGHVMDPTAFPIMINRVEYMEELLKRQPALYIESSPWGHFETLAKYADRYVKDTLFFSEPFTIYSLDRSMWHPADANFGNEIRFIGYDLLPVARPTCPGDTLTLAMTWQQIITPTKQYQMFVQLLTQDEQINLADYDGPVEDDNDNNPTNTWVDTGEIRLGERFDLAIPADVAPGTYKLIVGLYDVEAPDQRVPVLDANGAQVGSYALVQELTLDDCAS